MADRLLVERLTGFGLAQIVARRTTEAVDVGRILGAMPPDGPKAVQAAELTLLGTGPSTWLAIAEHASDDWFERLNKAFGHLASLSDQSSGYVVWRVAGSAARKLLQRGAAIDFDPGVFSAGSVATTMIAHIGVIIWQVDDAPTYHLVVFRSFAHSFRHWLDVSAAAL